MKQNDNLDEVRFYLISAKKSRGYTIMDLARSFKVSYATVWKLLNGVFEGFSSGMIENLSEKAKNNILDL